ncbi:MAG: hypothetical protein KC496_11695 [Anaerolineae bacterium]|nr:hypothetical protein [Anaerolineae bacterium]
MNRTQSRLFITLLLLLSLAAMILVIVSTPTGIGNTPDSIHYVTTTRSILSGAGWIDYSENLYDVWGPGYPLMLTFLNTLGGWFGLGLLEMIRLHNVALYGLLVFFSGLTFQRYTRSSVLSLLGTIWVLLSHVLLLVYAFAWSEPLFLLLVVLFFYFLADIPRMTQFRQLLPLVLVTAAAVLQRYPGAPLVPLGALSILLLMRTQPIVKRFIYAFGFGVLASAPLLLWLLRNYAITGTILGSRVDIPNPLMGQIGRAYAILVDWFTTNPLNIGYLDLLVVLVVALLLFVAAVYWRYRSLTPAAFGKMLAIPLASVSLFLWIVIYVGVAILRATHSPDVLENRVLSPIYIPLLCLILLALTKLAEVLSIRARRSWLGSAVSAGLLLLMMAYPVYQGLDATAYRMVACCQQPWADSELMQWVGSQEYPGKVYSNTYAPMVTSDVLIYRLPPTLELFEAGFPADDEGLTIILVDDLEAQGCVYSRQCITPDYTPQTLAQNFNVETLFENEEGQVYRVTMR